MTCLGRRSLLSPVLRYIFHSIRTASPGHRSLFRLPFPRLFGSCKDRCRERHAYRRSPYLSALTLTRFLPHNRPPSSRAAARPHTSHTTLLRLLSLLTIASCVRYCTCSFHYCIPSLLSHLMYINTYAHLVIIITPLYPLSQIILCDIKKASL